DWSSDVCSSDLMVGAGLLRKGERGKPACPQPKPFKSLRVLGMDDYRDRHRGGGHPPTPATPPCVRVRTRRFETVTLHSSTKVGSPRDLKYALESLTVRALVRARGQGPRPLLAVLRARRGETP